MTTTPTGTPLTRAQLAAIRAVLEVRLGWDHPLTQAIHEAHEATPVDRLGDSSTHVEPEHWSD